MVTYYHGGVPGRNPGDQILSASALGYHHYAQAYLPEPGVDHSGGTPYDPSFVSVTTHLGSARGYAARFVHPNGQREAGDVYEVQIRGPISDDPDFAAPGVYVRTPKPARVTRVVERGVILNRREQNRECWPYRYYQPGQPVHAEDGTVLASAQMRENGVKDAYLQLLPKWMDWTEFSNHGGIWAPDLPKRPASARYVLRMFNHLDIDTGPHVIEPVVTPAGVFLRCQFCAVEFGSPGALFIEDGWDACMHQTGPELFSIASHNCDGTLAPFAEVLSARHPDRWAWNDFDAVIGEHFYDDGSARPILIPRSLPDPSAAIPGVATQTADMPSPNPTHAGRRRHRRLLGRVARRRK